MCPSPVILLWKSLGEGHVNEQLDRFLLCIYKGSRMVSRNRETWRHHVCPRDSWQSQVRPGCLSPPPLLHNHTFCHLLHCQWLHQHCSQGIYFIVIFDEFSWSLLTLRLYPKWIYCPWFCTAPGAWQILDCCMRSLLGAGSVSWSDVSPPSSSSVASVTCSSSTAQFYFLRSTALLQFQLLCPSMPFLLHQK